MRNGVYAIYKGLEYKANSRGNKIVLISSNKEDIVNGFKLDVFESMYELLVNRCDVEKYYTKTLCCTYLNDNFIIVDEQDDRYLLISGPRSYLLSELGFKQTDRGEFQKWVLKNEVKDVFEKIKERK